MKFVMPSCLQLFGKSPHAKLSSLSTIVHRSQLTRFAAAFVDRELKCTVFTYWNNPPWGCFLRSFKRPEEWDSALKRRLSSTSGYSLPTHHQSGVEEMSTEESVGILCHANSCPGFRGVLKQRYSDFIVNEVDPLGNVIHLTNINAPVEVILSVYLFLNFSWFHSYPCYFLTVSFFSYTFSSGFNCLKCREDSSFVSSMQNLLRYTHTHTKQPRKM
jgi:hypothetical protein